MEQIFRILKSVEMKGSVCRNDFQGYWSYMFDLCEKQGLVEATHTSHYTSYILTKKGYRYMEIFGEFMAFFKSDEFFKTLEENN